MNDGALARRVASGVRWTGIQQGAEQLTRVVFTIVLARFVAPADFGLMSMAFVVTYVAILFSDLGVGAALVQRRDVRPAHVTTAFTASAVCGLLLWLLLSVTAAPLASFFREPRLEAVLVVMGLTFVCKGVQGVPRDLLRRELHFVPYTMTAAAALAVGVTTGMVAAVAGAGVWALVAYSLSESVTAMALSLGAAWRAGVWRPTIGFDRGALRDIAGFAGYTLGARGVVYVQSTADNVVVGRILGASALGFYGMAYRTMLLPVQKVADVVSTVAMPALAAVQDEPARLRAAYFRAQQAAAVVCFPLSLGMAAAAPVAVPFLLGAQWSPAIATVQILALNGPRFVLSRLAGALFQATGRPSWDFWTLGISVPAFLVAFIVGAQYGIEGVALGVTAVGTCVVLAQLVLVSRTLGCPATTPLTRVASPLAAALLGAGVVVGLRSVLPAGLSDIVVLAVVLTGGAVAYVGALAVIAPRVLPDAIADVLGRRRGPVRAAEAVA